MKINIGATQFGYKIEGNRILVDENEKFVIKKIYDLYLDKIPIIQIVSELNNKKLLSKRGKEWTNTSLSKLLLPSAIKFYAGYDENMKSENRDPIISEDYYKKLLSLRRESKLGQKRSSPNNYFLSNLGVFTCGYCGGSVKASITKRGPKKDLYYLCKNKQVKGKRNCYDSKLVKQEIVDEHVLGQLKIFTDNLDKSISNYESYTNSKLTIAVANISKLLSLKEINYNDIINELEASTTLSKDLIKMKENLSNSSIDFSNLQSKRDLLILFVKQINLFRNHLNIKFNLPLPSAKNFETDITL